MSESFKPRDPDVPNYGPLQYQDSAGNWRVKIVRLREGIHEIEKQTAYLKSLQEHGLQGVACRIAGVTGKSVVALRQKDKDFDEACIEAMTVYTDRLLGHHQNLVFNGTQKTTYDRNGNKVSEETIYPIRLIELELKKHDEGYRDKREVNMNMSGGVLVAPAEMESIEDWETKFSKAKDITPTEE